MSERMYQGIIGVLVLIILVGGAVMIGARGSSPSTTMGEESLASSSNADITVNGVGGVMQNDATVTQKGASGAQQATVSSGSDSVSVLDQPAGKNVIVKSVSLSKLGWVAVRQNGWILGAERVAAGTNGTVAVALLRPTKAGSSYEVVLFYDNGDKAFELHKDMLVTKADGSALSAAFLAK